MKRQGRAGAPRISLAVPVLDEADGIEEFLARSLRVLDSLPGGPHEIVVVDDGSTDETPERLMRAADADQRIRAVVLSRNFGHQVALSAALDHARGDVVVMLDGDGQDAPEAIPRFLEAYREGFDVVYAIRVRRKEGPLLRACYSVFYRVASALASIPLAQDSGDFALVSARVAAVMRDAPERARYLRGLRSWAGFRQIGIEVERGRRQSGTSKYSFGKLLRLALDGIFGFSLVPLRIASLLGLLALIASGGFALYALIAKLLMDRSPQGFTALIVAVVFLSGVQLLFLGIIGEYVGRIHLEVKNRPRYVVDRIFGPPPGLEPPASPAPDKMSG